MISDFYRSVHGGIEVLVRNLSHELGNRGHHVAIAAIAQEGFPPFESDGAVGVYRVATTAQRLPALYSDLERPAAPPFPDPEASLSLKRVLAREQPDIVHGHDWLVRSFLPLKRSSGAQLVVSLHYYILSCARKDLYYKDAARCTGPSLGKCFGCAVHHYGAPKGIPVVSGNFAAAAAERHAVDMYLPVSFATAVGNGLPGSGVPFEIIPNFVVNGSSPEGEDVESYVRHLPEGDFLLFVGDLGSYKGVQVLLEAYSSLERAPPLVLIGKAEPTQTPELPPNVMLLTDWPHQAVQEAHRRSLAVVVPSIWAEPFGMVVIEAMAAGRPVIASRVGGIPEIVEDGKTGLLVSPGDPAELRDAIATLLADPAVARRLGRAAHARAASFTAPAIVPRFEQVYSQLLGRSRPAQPPAG